MSVDGIYTGTTGTPYDVASIDDPDDPGKAVQKVAVRTSSSVVTGNLSTDTDTVEVDCAGYTSALLQVKDGGSYSGAAFELLVFEVSLDGSTWLHARYYWVDENAFWTNTDYAATTYAGMSAPVYVPLHGAVKFRVRMDGTPDAGSLDVVVALSMVAAPPPADHVSILSGDTLTVRATTGDPVHITTDGDVLVRGFVGESLGFQSGTITADDETVGGLLDQATFQVVGSFTGDLVVEVSADSTNWVALSLTLVTDFTTGAAPVAVGEGVYTVETFGPLYVRLRGDNSFTGPVDVVFIGVGVD